jgi:CspA family cold shock protein
MGSDSPAPLKRAVGFVYKGSSSQLTSLRDVMPTGQIVSIVAEKGFGFIKPTNGETDIFFHISALNCPLESVQVGQEVEYEVDDSAEKPRAKSVVVPGVKGFEPGARRYAGRRSEPVVKLECGFITKIVWKKQIGFVSADAPGPELQFAPNDVTGEKAFPKMKVGDYVQFVRNPVDATKNPLMDPPTIRAVEVIERVPKRLPRIGLPNNPRARKKKPTWR